MLHQVVDEGSSTRISEEELRQRKSKAVMSWLVRGLPSILPRPRSIPTITGNACAKYSSDSACRVHANAMQEHSVGKERVELVRMLQAHHVIVRGGPEEGQRLLDALLVTSTSCDVSHAVRRSFCDVWVTFGARPHACICIRPLSRCPFSMQDWKRRGLEGS